MGKFKRIVKDVAKIPFILTIAIIIFNIITPTYITGVCMGLCVGLVIADIIFAINKNSDRKDNLALKLEKVMHYATGGFLSNTNLSYETIEDAIKEHIKECNEEAVKKTKKDYNID